MHRAIVGFVEESLCFSLGVWRIHFDFGFHLALAALRAISRRRAGVRALARAGPPALPPFWAKSISSRSDILAIRDFPPRLPMSARYFRMGAGSVDFVVVFRLRGTKCNRKPSGLDKHLILKVVTFSEKEAAFHMAVFKRSNSPYYYYEFVFAGTRIQESTRTTSKTLARDAERQRRRELEQAAIGIPVESRAERVRSIGDFIDEYLEAYPVNHRPSSTAYVKARLSHVKRLLGTVLLTDLTEREVRSYMRRRQTEGVSGRTINMELGELSRSIGKPWSVLWPRIRKMEERKDVGKALSAAEESALLTTLSEHDSPNHSQTLGTFVRIALLTGMRSGEILNLTWGQVDFEKRVITVGRAKTSSGTGRQIPMNGELLSVLAAHAEWFTTRFGEATDDWYLFPYGKPTPSDPSRPTTTIKTAWNTLRREAGVRCRLHDLRHTAITKLAEAGISESTMLALAGHMSRTMLERYSHIRLKAKRLAMESLTTAIPVVVPEKVPTVRASMKLN